MTTALGEVGRTRGEADQAIITKAMNRKQPLPAIKTDP
jgi:hypothetical protein